jgi:hypothetical protein
MSDQQLAHGDAEVCAGERELRHRHGAFAEAAAVSCWRDVARAHLPVARNEQPAAPMQPWHQGRAAVRAHPGPLRACVLQAGASRTLPHPESDPPAHDTPWSALLNPAFLRDQAWHGWEVILDTR